MPVSLYKFTCGADELDVDIDEICRYMGIKRGYADDAGRQAALKALREVAAGSKPSAVYAVSGIKELAQEGSLDLGFGAFCSKDLKKCLSGCEKAVVFAATIGIYTDRLVNRYEQISPLRALAVNSAGTALIEAFCDCLCLNLAEQFQNQGFKCIPRFSAGYGDFPLQCQIGILDMLMAEKTLGISLDQSLLMTPAKSVTAVVGLKRA